MPDIATSGIGYWAQVRRDASGDLVTAAVYFGAYLAAPWLSDEVLVGLVVGVALQFFLLTPLLGVITAITEGGHGHKPLRRVVGADTYTPLAGAAFLVIPSEADIVAAASEIKA